MKNRSSPGAVDAHPGLGRRFEGPPVPSDAGSDFCFVHVPKTGGSSIRSLFVHSGFFEVTLRTPNITELTARAPGTKLTLFGHNIFASDYRTFQSYRGGGKERTFAFAFVRDPLERAISAYSYLRNCNATGINAHDIDDAKQYVLPFRDFTEFVLDGLADEAAGCREQTHLRPQYTWLCDSSRRLLVDHLGRYEDLAVNINGLLAMMGVPELPLPRLNVTERKEVGSVTKAVREAIQQVYSVDYELWAAARASRIK